MANGMSAMSMFVEEIDEMEIGEEFHFSDLPSLRTLPYCTRYTYVYQMYRYGSGKLRMLGNGYFAKVKD